LLLGLGFTLDQTREPVSSFSGGWRMRLNLAQALMCRSDLLLLDEPTNHLDLDAIVWLEDWLHRYAGTLIVISHDREFLDSVCNVTLHLEQQQVKRYGGNYSQFEVLRAQQIALQQSAYDKQQRTVAHLQSYINRFKAQATKARQAQSRVKALARMERLAPVLTSADFQFEFKEPASLPNPMLAFAGTACGYRGEDGTRRTVVAGLDRSVLAGQRIGILGANGQGKSTLVKTIAGVLAPLAGGIVAGKGLAIGYFAQQELDLLQPDDGPLMHLVRLARDIGPPAREQELRDFLGSFRFTGEMVAQPVGTLSGGEKARLVLAMLVWQRPNLLLLDEPTNHLDLATREALGMALNEFEGTVMLVSHDRALLRETCDEFWLVARGHVEPFDGDLDDYQRWLLDQSKAASRAARAEPTAPRVEAAPARTRDERKVAAQARQQRADAAKPLRQEINRVDNKLGVLFAERDALEAALAGTDPDPARLAESGRRLKAIAEQIEVLEARWLELSTQIDDIAESVA
jgi:ATP-binding cassette subfamily F protein 3